MNYLFVVAHPDDEVLGAGGTIGKLAEEGNKVEVCILCGEAKARKNRPKINKLRQDLINCCKILGVRKVYLGNFPNIEFNTVPHIRLVQFIEEILIASAADVVFTHHPADVNNDHHQTSLACQAAIRLFQRNTDRKPVKELFFMEIPSSTEWSLNSSLHPFIPNVFIEIKESGLLKKLDALSQYEGVMREYPHPRSEEAIKGLASFRGCQAGLLYAEGFELVFKREV
ncbi:PIG-L deacetylase family protein [Anaerocolumna xylanovorans]|uniref:N-acetylglucosaminyl deacetylase, LmbE family n=1 Tax=Anaerocolumna xylanovorans DSM 12503 TaxID=1121345 RepID=A0A1M7Y235_9FIRM|nr:PIG-L deacetylase family protein [Anaerocolumna xylanovorans]SHO45703.1 N-acetylglucosaminyl deacetylase, LmbE family [Anaerocolumna xylanovorans DSM 12503]